MFRNSAMMMAPIERFLYRAYHALRCVQAVRKEGQAPGSIAIDATVELDASATGDEA